MEPEGDAKEELQVEREVCAQDEAEATDVDETDNEDTDSYAEDEEMASQEEQRDAGVVRERIPETSILAASAPASTSTPSYQYQPDDGINKVNDEEGGPLRTADSDLLALPCGHLFHAGCLTPWLRSHTIRLTCIFDVDTESLTLVMSPPTTRGGPRERARE